VGFAVVDHLAERLSVSFKKRLFKSYAMGKTIRNGDSLYLVKPLTFMNASGHVFPEVLRETGLSPADILVICDSLDLSPGACRLKLKGSSGGHKGLASIITRLGTDDFMRLVIGIGRPPYKGQVVDFVLNRPGGEDSVSLEKGIDLAADAVLLLLDHGPIRVMNEINKKEPAS
jgi:PTH1 family peptidyl-tRNA hydrolase